ncbi:hypothetical protein ACH3XW_34935 [Acanthocheilonema viteae]
MRNRQHTPKINARSRTQNICKLCEVNFCSERGTVVVAAGPSSLPAPDLPSSNHSSKPTNQPNSRSTTSLHNHTPPHHYHPQRPPLGTRSGSPRSFHHSLNQSSAEISIPTGSDQKWLTPQISRALYTQLIFPTTELTFRELNNFELMRINHGANQCGDNGS